MNIYSKSKAVIQLEKKGSVINIEKGVRQGDPLSPKLFSAVLEQIFRKFDWDDRGFVIDGTPLHHLRFADDLILFAKNAQELEEMFKDLAFRSKQFGLSMNLQKTKVMTNGIKHKITLEHNTIEYVDNYPYLGQIISTHNQMSLEIDKRVASAWNRYWTYKNIMKDKTISMTVKRKLFDTCVLPILTYGCQTWALTKHHLHRLQVCQRAIERSMSAIKLSDRKTTQYIRHITQVKDVTLKIKTLKWKWAGHMVRGRDKWSKQITLWQPRIGKRKKGRQRTRWADEIVKVAGKTWTRKARDRNVWKGLEEAFARGQTDTNQAESEVTSGI